jgi:dienelactone hydrolase
MILRVLRWAGLTFLAALTLLVASSCTMLGLNYASLETANKVSPMPPLDAARLQTPEGRAEARKLLEDTLYGPWPAGLPVGIGAWRMINPDYMDGRGTLEELDITIGNGPGARLFHLVAAFPKAAMHNPVVISQTFSSNCAVFPGQAVTSEDGDPCTARDNGPMVNFLVTRMFGEYIAEAPVDRFFDEGFVYVSFHAGDLIPDSVALAPKALAGLGGDVNPTSTLMAWAYGFSAAIDALEQDPRVDTHLTSVMGHSRHGKAALLATVWDPRIEAVIAHQSGFAGSALSRSQTGETLARMVKSYPHWLAPDAAKYAANPDLLPFDQHLLLALVAPRRLFLGNGRRDVWSDPNSSFRAAKAASVMWNADGKPGLEQDSMRTFEPAESIVWWLRPGGHGIVEEDIEAFIAFLKARPTPSAASPPAELPTVAAPG